MTWANYSTSLKLFSYLSNRLIMEVNQIMFASAAGIVEEILVHSLVFQRQTRRGRCPRMWTGDSCSRTVITFRTPSVQTPRLRQERFVWRKNGPRIKGKCHRRATAGGQALRLKSAGHTISARSPQGLLEAEKGPTGSTHRWVCPRNARICAQDARNYIPQEAPGV